MTDAERIANAINNLAEATRKVASEIGCLFYVVLFASGMLASAINALK